MGIRAVSPEEEKEGYKPGMKECMGDGWWEWWVDRTDGEVPLKELCESGLERLELGWWREAGSWFQRRGEINSFPIFIMV